MSNDPGDTFQIVRFGGSVPEMGLSFRSLRFGACLAACLSCTPTTGQLPEVAGTQQGPAAIGMDTRRFDALVGVAADRMHLRCEGEGTPLVVFESGFGPGGDSSMWREVLPRVARETQACAYDRLGQGRSSPPPHPHSMRQMARELHALLDTAERKGPFVLVGHSMGGAVARWFEMEYKDEVAGIVLVDATTAASAHDAFSTVTAEMLREWEATIRQMEGQNRKDVIADLESLRDSRQTLGAQPLVAITAGRPEGNLHLRQALRAEFDALSSNSVDIVAETSGHLVPLEQAELVTSAALAVVYAARSGRSLSALPFP